MKFKEYNYGIKVDGDTFPTFGNYYTNLGENVTTLKLGRLNRLIKNNFVLCMHAMK
jgi:hypothetical protein